MSVTSPDNVIDSQKRDAMFTTTRALGGGAAIVAEGFQPESGVCFFGALGLTKVDAGLAGAADKPAVTPFVVLGAVLVDFADVAGNVFTHVAPILAGQVALHKTSIL